MGKLVQSAIDISRGKNTSAALRQRLAAEQTRLDKIYSSAQFPDEEEIKRNERRKAAKRRGSRADTVLTEETLG